MTFTFVALTSHETVGAGASRVTLNSCQSVISRVLQVPEPHEVELVTLSMSRAVKVAAGPAKEKDVEGLIVMLWVVLSQAKVEGEGDPPVIVTVTALCLFAIEQLIGCVTVETMQVPPDVSLKHSPTEPTRSW